MEALIPSWYLCSQIRKEEHFNPKMPSDEGNSGCAGSNGDVAKARVHQWWKKTWGFRTEQCAFSGGHHVKLSLGDGGLKLAWYNDWHWSRCY